MPNVLRLRRTPVSPEPNRNSEAVYANAAGELKQVAPDGSETDLGGGGGGSQPLSRTWVTLTAEDVTAGTLLPFFDFGPDNDEGISLGLVEFPSTVINITLSVAAGPGWTDDLASDGIVFGYPPGATVQDWIDHIAATPAASARLRLVETRGDTSREMLDTSGSVNFGSIPSGLTLAAGEVLFGVLGDVTDAFDQGAAIGAIGDGVDGGDVANYTLDLTSATPGTLIHLMQALANLDPPFRTIGTLAPVLVLSGNIAPTTGSADLCYIVAAAAS